MKSVRQIVPSIVLSSVASILASWLLRRLLFLVEQPGSGSTDTSNNNAIVVVVPIIIGNSPTVMRGRGMERGRHRHPHKHH